MQNFVGTWRLIRLALRRDRVKLTVWILAIVGLLSFAAPTLMEVYGSSQQAITMYAATTSQSKIALLFGGPVGGPYFGAVVMLEYFVFTATLLAFMSYLAVIRHTRQNEETNRSELVGSGPVGRQAPLTAALIVTLGANLAVAVLSIPSLVNTGLPIAGVIAMTSALAGVGIVFAGVGAVAAQIVGSARGAAGLTGLVLAVAILVRGLGDMLGKIAPSGLSTNSIWLSWLSPFGWGQQMQPFNAQTWSVLSLYVVAFIALISLAFYLNNHRDFGLGMIAAQLGRARAKLSLLNLLGLAWRLQGSILVAWGLGVVLLSVVLGVVTVEIKDFMLNNEQLLAVLGSFNTDNILNSYFAAMLMMTGLVIAGYGLMSILKLRAEEAELHLEAVLGTASRRLSWLASHLIIVIIGVVLLSAAMGFVTGLGYALASNGQHWDSLAALTVAGLVQAPAILLLVGLAVALFGLISRWVSPLVWSIFSLSLVISMLGELLRLPNWVLNLSPFYHTPLAPASSVDIKPLIIMLVIAIVLMFVGLVAFKRRDIAT